MFVGPYEHHSNLLPWRELGATVVPVSETTDGLVDLEHLNQELQVCTLGCTVSPEVSMSMPTPIKFKKTSCASKH